MQRTKQCALVHLNSYFGVVLSHSPKVRFQITDIPWSLWKLFSNPEAVSALHERYKRLTTAQSIQINGNNICIAESVWSRYYKQQQQSLNKRIVLGVLRKKNINQFAAVLARVT